MPANRIPSTDAPKPLLRLRLRNVAPNPEAHARSDKRRHLVPRAKYRLHFLAGLHFSRRVVKRPCLGFNLKQIKAPRQSCSRNLIRKARCRPSRLQSPPQVLNPIPAKSFFASKHYHTSSLAGLGVVRAVQPSQLTTQSQPLAWVKGSYQKAT